MNKNISRNLWRAWQAAFRTFDWAGAVLDPESVKRQVTELVNLV